MTFHEGSSMSSSSLSAASTTGSSGRSHRETQSPIDTRFRSMSSSVNTSKAGSSLILYQSSVLRTSRNASYEFSAVKYKETDSPFPSFSAGGRRDCSSASSNVAGRARVTCLAGRHVMTPRLRLGSTGSFAFGHIAPSKSKSQTSHPRNNGAWPSGEVSLVALGGCVLIEVGCATTGIVDIEVGVALGSVAG